MFRTYTVDEMDKLKSSITKAIDIIRENNIPHGIDLHVPDNTKITIFADVHGDIETLRSGLSKLKQLKTDYIIFCGDYIDKGQDDMGCFQTVLDTFINDPKHVIPLIGNHEDGFCFSLIREIYKSCEELNQSPDELVNLCLSLIRVMPICCFITFDESKRKIYCAHGAIPFRWHKRLTHIHDEYEKAWQMLGFNADAPQNVDEMIYEDNTTIEGVKLNPAQYVNYLYDSLTTTTLNPVETPKNMFFFSDVVEVLDSLLSGSISPADAKTKLLNNKRPYQLKTFISKWNDYKAYIANVEKAKNAIFDIRAYIMWGDMYVAEATKEEVEAVDSLDKYMAFVKSKGTEFICHERAEVKRHQLCYPEQILIDWMNRNNVSAVIRGHEFTTYLARVRDLKKGQEFTPEDGKPIHIDEHCRLYLCFHTTKSYNREAGGDVYLNTPNVFVLNGCSEIIDVRI